MERIKKDHEEEIMKRIKEAGDSSNYETSWDDKGIPKSKKKSEVKRGKKARASGTKFENKVREDLEKKGWTVAKWTDNIEFYEEENETKL